ncbi:craniofacial development protein 2-like [Battus philenor]|uniref:craniofacial development protein 2-like n=1 Tax=Battus philenor TaxID=42288 RepID=UPI0035D126B4
MRRLGERIEEHKNYILFQKGETAGQRGVGFIIKKFLKQYIQELIGISERLALLIIKFPGYKKQWAIMQVYAPTEQAEQSVVDAFYEEVSLTVKTNTDKHIILMGDFNAQVGGRQNNEEYVLGKYGQGKRSKNGEKLISFLMEHNLTLMNSIFKKKNKNEWTWISPDGAYKNEIDFVISSYPKAFTDTTVISTLNFNTNHRKVRSSLRKFPNKTSRKHIKTW